jgi:NAD+ synthase
VVLGLSGGIDSSLSAVLAIKALGKDNVTGLILPYKTSSGSSAQRCRTPCKDLWDKDKTIEISPMVDAYFDKTAPEANSLRRGNFMARMRMSVLYDYSARYLHLCWGQVTD